MTLQRTNHEMIDLLSPHFIRNRFPFAVYGGGAGVEHWTATGVAATAIVALPDASFDAGAILMYSALVKDSGGGVVASMGSLIPGTDDIIYDDGTDVCTLRVNANGSVDVRRTAGAATFTVKLSFQWIS